MRRLCVVDLVLTDALNYHLQLEPFREDENKSILDGRNQTGQQLSAIQPTATRIARLATLSEENCKNVKI